MSEETLKELIEELLGAVKDACHMLDCDVTGKPRPPQSILDPKECCQWCMARDRLRTLASEIEDLLQETPVCDHPVTCIEQGREGTCYCRMCELEGELEKVRQELDEIRDALNAYEDSSLPSLAKTLVQRNKFLEERQRDLERIEDRKIVRKAEQIREEETLEPWEDAKEDIECSGSEESSSEQD